MARILVVEDDLALGENLKAMLELKGHKIYFASDGHSAVEVARKEKPDIMLLDIMLPRLGGYDVCRIIKSEEATRAIKIIVITGLGRMGDVETAFSAGAFDYVIKPFDSERLLKKVDKALAAP